MQQFSRICMIVDHDQRQIEYVCIYPECNLSRFACSKCVRMGNHKHQQQDQSHVLDHKELQEVLQEKLSKRQKQQGANLQTKQLKSIIELIQNSLKNMINMIQQLEQGIDYNHIDQLNQLLFKLRNNQFDDVQINILMNMDEKVGDFNTSLLDQSNIIINNAIRIQEWCQSQLQDYGLEQKIRDYKYKDQLQDYGLEQKKIRDSKSKDQQQDYGLEQKVRDSKYKVITLEDEQFINSSVISNDFKYIVFGGDGMKLKIWNYGDNTHIKSIEFDDFICKIKFTDDSSLLYVGTYNSLYQFDVNNNFKETYKQSIHLRRILNIFCITNTIILTSSWDKQIIKTDVNLKQQLLFIQAHDNYIAGLDYNHNLDKIASSSDDGSIKIWNGDNGQLVLEKQNAYNNNSFIKQVLFVIKGNQLISQNERSTIVWKINYETKQLEQQQLISNNNFVYNISLVLNQQFITIVCSEYIKIYSIKGDYIRQFNHDIKGYSCYNTIQPQSIKAIAIQGQKTLQICKVELDLD